MTPQLIAARAMYEAVPEEIKEDLILAVDWAKKTLTEKEGGGWIMQVHPENHDWVMCTFSKPEWGGEHAGSYRDTASEAVVMAVCEYLTEDRG